MTVAQLGLAVDSSPVERATPSLERMTAAAARAEAAAGNLGRATSTTSAVMQKMLAVLESMERDLTIVARAASVEAEAMNTSTAAVQRNTVAHHSNGMAMANSRNLMFQLVDIGQGLPLMFQNAGYGALNLGNQLAQIGQAYHGQGGFGAAFRDFGGLLRPMLPLLAGVGTAVALIGAVFAGLTTKINETAKTQVSFGNVFMATIQLAAESIGRFFRPAIDQLGKWWQQFVDWITPLFKGVVNMIVGSFVFGFNAVKDTWSLLPDAFASIFTKAMNGAIDIVQNGINAIIGPVNDLLSKVGMTGVPLADLSQFKGVPSNADQKVGGIIAADASAAFSQDYAGQAFGAISARSQKLALDAASKSADKAKASVRSLTDDGMKYLTTQTNAFADAAKSAFSNLGSSLIAAFQKGGNIAANVLGVLLDKVSQLSNAMLDKTLNGLINNGINSLFGVTIAQGAAIPGKGFIPGLTGPKLFADGGFTGYGGKYEPAGIVHRGEYVFDQASVGRIGIGRLNAMRGYADGGLVGANQNGMSTGGLVVHVHNYGNDEVRTERSGSELHVIVGKMVGQEISRPGSPAYRALRTVHGTSPQLTSR